MLRQGWREKEKLWLLVPFRSHLPSVPLWIHVGSGLSPRYMPGYLLSSPVVCRGLMRDGTGALPVLPPLSQSQWSTQVSRPGQLLALLQGLSWTPPHQVSSSKRHLKVRYLSRCGCSALSTYVRYSTNSGLLGSIFTGRCRRDSLRLHHSVCIPHS